MVIRFYNCSAESIKVDKTNDLTNLWEVQGYLKEGCDITNPSILIEKSDGNMFNYNYCRIIQFNRYYFIDSVVSENNKLWRVNMHVDVLMTYKTQILEVNAFIDRNENDYKTYLQNNIMSYKYDKLVYEYKPTQTGVTNLDVTTKPIYYVLTFYSKDFSSWESPSDNIPVSGLLPSVNTARVGDNASSTTGLLRVEKSQTTDDSINGLVRFITSHSNVTDFIVNCVALPFNVEKATTGETSRPLSLGTTFIEDATQSLKVYVDKPKHQIAERILVGNFKIERAEEYQNYEPYCTYEVYLPFKGWVTLSAEQILNKDIKVYYTIEYSTGIGYIQVITNDNVIYEDTCQIGVTIPFTTTNNQERVANIMTGLVSTAIHYLI